MKLIDLTRRRLRLPIVIICLALAATSRFELHAASGKRGVVSTGHPVATQAALETLKKGGNAVDAAVAAAATLGVVDGYNSGLGGGCFILIHLAGGRIVAVDGREMAPAAATRDMYVRDGKADTRLSQIGPLASGVPGALAAWEYALTNFGRLSLKEILLPVARLADDGFEIEAGYARRIEATARDLNRFEGSRAIFLRPDGSPRQPGETLKQSDLAGTYRGIAGQGSGWFYRGPFAQMTARWMREQGGIMTETDFANYRIRRREPVRTTYRGHEIIGFSPPSSGGVHVAQILNLLENFELKPLGPRSADFVHLVAEAMKLAFADRAFWLGDPDFAKVPRGIVSKEYGAELSRKIRRDEAVPVRGQGEPPRAQDDVFGQHTTHFSIADAEGNWVALTATINTTFGSKVVIPGTGVMLNNEMDDFSIEPGVPNAFGLLGAEANAVEPGKRPLSSMSPTIVLKDGKPIFSVGAAGGPTIISQTLLAILHTIEFGLDPKTALAQPRFHHQWSPDELRIEKGFGEAVLEELARRGHKLKPTSSFGAAQAVGFVPGSSEFTGAADPRGNGRATGW